MDILRSNRPRYDLWQETLEERAFAKQERLIDGMREDVQYNQDVGKIHQKFQDDKHKLEKDYYVELSKLEKDHQKELKTAQSERMKMVEEVTQESENELLEAKIESLKKADAKQFAQTKEYRAGMYNGTTSEKLEEIENEIKLLGLIEQLERAARLGKQA